MPHSSALSPPLTQVFHAYPCRKLDTQRHDPGGGLCSNPYWSLDGEASCTDFEHRVLAASRLVSKPCSGSKPRSHGHFFPEEPFRDVCFGEQNLVSLRQTRPLDIVNLSREHSTSNLVTFIRMKLHSSITIMALAPVAPIGAQQYYNVNNGRYGNSARVADSEVPYWKHEDPKPGEIDLPLYASYSTQGQRTSQPNVPSTVAPTGIGLGRPWYYQNDVRVP